MRGVAGNRWFFRRGLRGVYWDFAPIWLGLLFLIAACADPGPERTAAVDAGIGREDPRSGTPAALEQGLAAYARVLGRLVRSGCLDLAALEEDAAIASDLAAARLLLGQVAPHELPVAARLPFWIDLHNLCLLEGLLAGLQQDPDFHVGWYTFDLLRERRCPVGGAVLTLTEIVSGVRGVPDPLADRPFAQTFPTQVDPRVHCALYQGARSGPSLPALPLSGDEAEVRLARACSRWLNHPWRGAGPDGLSAIFSWYAEDFQPAGPAAFLLAHRARGLQDVDLEQRLSFSWLPDRYVPDDPYCRSDLGGCEPRPEECNGVDDDCDGHVDEGVLPPPELCTRQGICRELAPICYQGRWACLRPAGYEDPEVSCDGLDNDCDGQVDEELTPPVGLCTLVGVCLAAGPPVCEGAAGWRCPAAPGYEEPEQSCDGQDNDCNGLVDDVPTPPAGVCKPFGVCVDATAACVAGEWQCTYPATYEPNVELSCDGRDNDCDGTTDEEVPNCNCPNGELRECGVDEGQCSKGIQRCYLGTWFACSGLDPRAETCDGLDNDCDGLTDEGLAGCECVPGRAEPCPPRGQCYPGWRYCQPDGRWGECYGAELPEPEVCDGWDNDCDGGVDEAAELVRGPELTCRSGGVCGPEQPAVCHEGRWNCLYPLGFEPVERSCDGLDNDCDGSTDEDLQLPDLHTVPYPVAWDDPECWAGGDWEGPAGCCPPRFRVARCRAGRFEACCLFEICGDAEGRDDDCDGRADDPECPVVPPAGG